MPAPLPASGPATLLRALFKRPHVAMAPADLASTYRLDTLPLSEIARYRAAFGFIEGAIPLTWWYLPAQRAQLATMLDARFPFRIAGLVHTDNALEELSTMALDQVLILHTVLRLPPPAANGALRCVLETTGSTAQGPVFRCTSTYLARRGDRAGARRAAEAAPPFAPLTEWRLDTAAGRRYARLSGDWNPIHLSGWSARLLGMRAPIIHGMHTLASSCAALERASGRHALAIDCAFRAPVPLGATVALSASADCGEFVVTAAGKPAARGSCTLA